MKNDNIEYTTVLELMTLLQKEVENGNGDMPICINKVTPVVIELDYYYYDGGYIAKDVNNYRNYLRSSTRKEGMTCVSDGFSLTFLNLSSHPVDDDHEVSINDRNIRDIDPHGWDFLDHSERIERSTFGGQLVEYHFVKGQDQKYIVEASLPDGTKATGDSRAEARDRLKEVFESAK